MIEKQETQRKEILTLAYREYVKSLNTYALYKVSNRALSEDLVQTTFMKTWAYLLKGGKIDVMKAFLYHILNHLIIDEHRKHKTASLDVLLEEGFEPSSDTSESLFNTLDGRAAVEHISELPEPYKKVMRMKYVQDLTLNEMSTITGESRNTLAVQAHRGLEKLKTLCHTA